MIMLCASVNAAFLKHCSAETVLGKHTFHRAHNDVIAALRHKGFNRDNVKIAGSAAVTVVLLFFELVAGKNDLIGVYDNNVVACVNVGREFGLVFGVNLDF